MKSAACFAALFLFLRMKNNYPIIFSFLIIAFLSCDKKFNIHEVNRSDSSYYYFSKGKLLDKVSDKLIYFDKALSHLKNEKDTLRPILWDYKIYYHDILKEYDSSRIYAVKLLDNGILENDTLQIAKGYYRLAKNYLYQNEHLEVLKNMYLSQQYYLYAADSISAGKRLVELGIAQRRLGDFTGSQGSQVKALQLFKNFSIKWLCKSVTIVGRFLDISSVAPNSVSQSAPSRSVFKKSTDELIKSSNLLVVSLCSVIFLGSAML